MERIHFVLPLSVVALTYIMSLRKSLDQTMLLQLRLGIDVNNICIPLIRQVTSKSNPFVFLLDTHGNAWIILLVQCHI
jgi:hypothetical protein